MDQKLIDKRQEATGHAVASPSQLHRIIACPASLKESLHAPIPKQSIYAKIGTLKHELTAHLAEGHTPWKEKDGYEFTVEDYQDIDVCLEFADELRDQVKYDGKKYYEYWEKLVTLDDLGMPMIYGTSDLIIGNSKQLHVVDWKFGKGIQVFADENPQLMAYALGAIYSLESKDIPTVIDKDMFTPIDSI